MDNTESVKRQFGLAAQSYVDSSIHAKGSDLAKLLEVVKPSGSERVLDLATGTGHTALALAPRVAHVVGLDVTPQMLDHARQLAAERGLANVEFVEGSADDLPFPSGSLDLVTCRIAAHHFGDPARAFAEVARVLEDGGRFLVIDNFAPDSDELDRFINTLDRQRDPSHVRAYRLHEWEALFRRHGLDFAVLDVWDTPHDFEAWVHQCGAPETTVVALRRQLVEAPPAIRQAFRIATNPELTFAHPKAMMVGVKGSGE